MGIFVEPTQPSGLEKFIGAFTGGVQMSLPQVMKDMQQQRNLKRFASMLGGQGGGAGGDLSQMMQNPMMMAYASQLGFGDAFSKAGEMQMKQKELEMKQQKASGKMPPERVEDLLGGIDELKELTPYVGSGFGTKTFGGDLRRETLQKRSQIDSQASEILSIIKEMDSKGNLPKGIYEDMLKRVPKSTDSERVYKGKLDAFKSILNRQLPRNFRQKQMESGQSQRSQQKPQFDISNPEHKKRRDFILKQTKGNRQKAHELLLQEFQQ